MYTIAYNDAHLELFETHNKEDWKSAKANK